MASSVFYDFAGPAGPQGATGPTGPTGPAGATGATGPAGGGGSPASPSGSVQFNDSGNFGGFGSWDGTNFSVLNIAAPSTTLNFKAELAPIDASSITPVLAGAGAGNLSNGVYSYKFTVNDLVSGGETELGTATAPVTVVDASTNGQVTLTLPYFCDQVSPNLNIYRTTAGGSQYKLLDQLFFACQQTYTDNTADASLGVVGPTTNTTLFTQLSLIGNSLVPVYGADQDGRELTFGIPGDSFFYLYSTHQVAPNHNGLVLGILAGDANGSGNGGAFNIGGGAGWEAGKGGTAAMFGGPAGGTAIVQGGYAASNHGGGNGGDVQINGGSVFSGGGNQGEIIMSSHSITSGTDNLPVCRHSNGTLYVGTNVAGVAHCS